MSEQPKFKAYKISCNDEDHGASVVFAKNGKEARGRDNRDCDCEFIDVYIHRYKQFDDLSPGPVIIEEYLARGWSWCCHGCDRHVYDDCEDRIIRDGRVWHSFECLKADRARWPQITAGTHESVIEYCRVMDEIIAERLQQMPVKHG